MDLRTVCGSQPAQNWASWHSGHKVLADAAVAIDRCSAIFLSMVACLHVVVHLPSWREKWFTLQKKKQKLLITNDIWYVT